MDDIFRRIESMTPHQRRVSLKLTLPTAILAIAFSTLGRAEGMNAAAGGGLQAKIEYCEECHGPSAQGYRGYYPIPRLAGQHPEYLENQLRAFAERGRPNSIMAGVARSLSPAMISALATHFSAVSAKPLGGTPSGRAGAGREIFENGVPDANVAACAACHGPDALGTAQFPRLAGQLYPYLVKELTNWSTERGQNRAKPDTSAVMAPVAHSLNRPQVEAIAAFLSNLK
jgi:cytochrome c553